MGTTNRNVHGNDLHRISNARKGCITIDHNGPDAAVCRRALDGTELSEDFITLVDDGRDHEIEIEMRPAALASSEART